MASSTKGKYKIKNTAEGAWADAPEGVHILSVEGLSSKGKAVNVFTQQWIDSQDEDFMITALDSNGKPKVIRENVDITVTLIVGQRYTEQTIDVQSQYDTFVDYMTDSDVWIASTYVGKQVHCMALDKVEPKTVKLHRGGNTYIVGELTLHTLEKPSAFSLNT